GENGGHQGQYCGYVGLCHSGPGSCFSAGRALQQKSFYPLSRISVHFSSGRYCRYRDSVEAGVPDSLAHSRAGPSCSAAALNDFFGGLVHSLDSVAGEGFPGRKFQASRYRQFGGEAGEYSLKEIAAGSMVLGLRLPAVVCLTELPQDGICIYFWSDARERRRKPRARVREGN